MYWHDINCLVSFLAYINRSALNIYKLHYFPVNIFSWLRAHRNITQVPYFGLRDFSDTKQRAKSQPLLSI